jgi:hypothetical protein
MIEQLRNITGPLGPFVPWQERLAAQERWKNFLTLSDIREMQSLLHLCNDDLEAFGLDADETCILLLEGLAMVATKDDSKAMISFLQAMLDSEERRDQVLDTIGSFDILEVPHLLDYTLSHLPSWGENTAISLASALGTIHSESAKSMLDRLENIYPANAAVLGEIQSARTNLQG